MKIFAFMELNNPNAKKIEEIPKSILTNITNLKKINEIRLESITPLYSDLKTLNWINIDYNYNLFLNEYMEEVELPVKYKNHNIIGNPTIWIRVKNKWKQNNSKLWIPEKY